MALTTILEEQTVTVEYSEEDGLSSTFFDTPLVAVGETYTVVWDGTEYECVAQDYSAMQEGAVGIGNGAVVGGDDSGEPFIFVTIDSITLLATTDTETTTHTVAIYQGTAEEEQEGIILKDRNGNDVAYYGIETVTFDTTTEGKQQMYTKGVKAEKAVELSLADGDQTVEPDEGTLLSKVTIQKPETLLPENIRKGVELAGVTGELIGDTEEVSVALDFSGGDMEVTPGEDKLISKVTIPVPESLVPENIAKDVTVAGVVGTMEAGGGDELILDEEPWLDDICFWDYDGTLLLNVPLSDVATLSELPTPPSHDGLTFQGWNYTLEQVKSYEYPIDVGAVYIPSDGNTHLHLSITSASYLAVPLNFQQTVENGVSIDWGDGSAATTVSGTVVSTTHTYSAIGEYDVVITVADGCTMTLGSGTSSTVFVGGSTTAYREYLTELYIGYNVDLASYAIYYNTALNCLTLPNTSTLTTVPSYCCYQMNVLLALIIPSNVVSIETRAAYLIGFYAATYRYPNVISIPESITSLGDYCVYYLYGERLSLPKTITSLGTAVCSDLRNAKRLFLSPNIISMGSSCVNNCYKIEKLTIPEGLTALGDSFLQNAYSLKTLRIPPNIKTIGSGFCRYASSLRDIYIPASVESIGTYMFYSGGLRRMIVEGTTTFAETETSNKSLYEVIHLSETVPSVIPSRRYQLTVWAPDSAVASYQSKYTTEYALVRGLSEYRGTLPTGE